jgi:hypothetical protein
MSLESRKNEAILKYDFKVFAQDIFGICLIFDQTYPKLKTTCNYFEIAMTTGQKLSKLLLKSLLNSKTPIIF